MTASEEKGFTAEDAIDALAAIELQRQELHTQPDPEAWRRLVLDKLEQIRLQLEEDLRLHGPSAERSAAAQALRVQISRVKGGSSGPPKKDAGPQGARPEQQGRHRRDARRPSRGDQDSRRRRRGGGR